MCPHNVQTLFEHQVARSANRIAVRSDGVHLTYRELYQRALSLSLEISRFHAESNVVAVMLSRSIDSVAVILATLWLGAAYLPVDPATPIARIEYVLRDAAPSCIVVDSDSRDRIPCDDIAVVMVEPTTNLFSDKNTSAQVAAHSVTPLSKKAYIMYTSGTTGYPKGVVISESALSNFISALTRTIAFTPTDKLLALTRTTFDISLLELLVPLVTGGEVVIATEDELHDGARLADMISRFEITTLQATPSYLSWFAESHSACLRGLRVLVGGEPFPRELARVLAKACTEVWNLYGPTETTIWAATHKVAEEDFGEHASRIVTIGRPMPGYSMYVFGDSMNELPTGTAGELYIGGPSVADGYLNRDDLTSRSFCVDMNNPNCLLYRTGDLAKQRADGNFEFMGRSDRQVKIRGMRVELEEIESQLRKLSGVRDAAVVFEEGVSRERRLLAYVVSHNGASIGAREIKEALSKLLPDYMIPNDIVTLRSFPLSAHGKLDRASLAAMEYVSDASQIHSTMSDERMHVQELFRSALGTESIRLDDNFIDLGGHSLSGMRLVSKIRSDFGVNIPLSLIFDADSIGEVVEEVVRLRGGQQR